MLAVYQSKVMGVAARNFAAFVASVALTGMHTGLQAAIADRDTFAAGIWIDPYALSRAAGEMLETASFSQNDPAQESWMKRPWGVRRNRGRI